MNLIRILILAVLVGTVSGATSPLFQQGGVCQLRSPDGNLKVNVETVEGCLTYAVTDSRTPVLEPSPLGITVDGIDLGKNPRLGEATVRRIDETYSMVGKHAAAHSLANEFSIPVVSGDKRFRVQIRVQNDGIAVRYLLPEGTLRVDCEATAWNIAAAKHAAWQDWSPCYEGHDHATEWSKVPENKRIAGLITVETAGHFIFLSEADNANYPDFAFERQGNTVKPVWYADAKGFTLNTPAQLATPWRIAMITKDLNGLVNSDLIPNLCPPPASQYDFAFVKPGRILWQWCSIGAPEYHDQTAWLDAAARLKWEYYMIDDGWSDWKKPGKNQWELLTEVIDYGKTKGVESIIWVNSNEMRDAKNRRAYLEKVKATGAVGIKIDFIPDASAKVMQWYDGTLRDTAELRLMTIFHGCVKPTGRERTWPHALTREGNRGNECHVNKFVELILPFDHDVTQPFTRFLAGAGDITPTILDPARLRGYSWPHMLAQSITTYSPLACFYDHYKFYVCNPAEDLFRDLPTTWDETRVLPCSKIGKVAAFARRKGDTWWIGVVNGAEAATVEIPFDFLKGTAKATLLRDAQENADWNRQETSIAPNDKITLELRKGGGFAARLTLIR